MPTLDSNNDDDGNDADTTATIAINNTVDSLTSNITNPSTSQQSVTANMLSCALNSAMAITQPIKNEPVFDQLNETDAEAVDNSFEESHENYGSDDEVMIHRNTMPSTMLPKPIGEPRNPYQVKVNDIVSGNIPFAMNVSVFFASY